MALEDEVRKTNELLAEFVRKAGGGGGSAGSSSGGSSSGKSISEADKAASGLANSLNEAKASFQNLQRTSKDYGTVSKLNNVAHNLFGKSTLEAQEHMNALSEAISSQQQVWRDAKKAGNEEVAGKARATLMNLQQQKANNEVNAQAASALGGSVGGLISTFAGLENKLIGIEAQYQAQMMQMVSQGASGFSLFGASVEANIDKVTAASDAYADAASKAGNALGQMGGVVLPLVGFALNLMADRARAVAQANATLAKQGIRILVEEGNKLIKTHMEMTSTGLIFANGMKGMVDATAGTKLRLEEMSAVVKENRESFAGMGMGMTAATELIGGVAKKLASTTGKFANADRQLLALGFSYQEQAALAAETAESMSRGGQKQNADAVAQATIEMAKNMSLVAAATGEDMKEKKKKMQQEQNEFAVKGALAKLARDEPERYKKLMAQQLGMTDAQRKASNEMLVFGTVRDKDLAIQMALNSGLRKSVQANDEAFRNGTASTEQALRNSKRNAKETQDANTNMAETVGRASMALGTLRGVATNSATDMDQNQRLMNSDIDKIIAERNKQLEAAGKPTKAGDPTGALLDAIEVGATAAKEMQQKVVNVIGEIAEQLKKHYDGLKGAFDKRDYTGGGAGSEMPLSMGQILALMIGLPIVRGLMMGGFTAAMNKVRTGSWLGKTPDVPTTTTTTAGPASPGGRSAMTEAEMKKYNANREAGMSAAEAKRQAQGFKSMNRTAEAMAERTKSVADGLAQTGPRTTSALNTATKEVGVLGKSMNFMKGGFQKLGSKIPIVGTALTVAMTGFNIAGIEARQAAGEITAEEARVEEGGAVGGAAGGLSGGLAGAAAGAAIGSAFPVIGTVIGGLIGGAIGAWGGEELGSRLGESLMSNWGAITDWTSKMGQGVADAWTSTKSWLATDGKQYWNMFTDGAKSLGKSALGLLETLPVVGGIVKGAESLFASAGEKFKSAGQTIRGFLDDSAAKFRQTFPELTAGVEKVVGNMKTGLGTLMDTMSEKASAAWGYIKEKTGFGNRPSTDNDALAKANADAKPAGPPGTAPAATTPAKSTPPPKVDAVGVPQKKELTSQEKAAIYETIATNTKYTNDLMQAQQRAINSMLQQLAAIAGHTNDTAVASKKTAQRVN